MILASCSLVNKRENNDVLPLFQKPYDKMYYEANMKIDFKVTGTMEIPDDAIKHYDVAGKLYALEFNDIMYMLQVCIVAEQGAGGFDILHQFEDMENHRITNVRYDDAEFFESE